MGQVVITRSSEWNNRRREIGIYVDGEKLGTVANGDTKTFELPSGPHTIKAKIDWCGSREKEFSISDGQKKYFRLSGWKFGNIVMPATFLIIVLHIILKRVAGIHYLIWLVIPGFFSAGVLPHVWEK
jgi:hypothetical protein